MYSMLVDDIRHSVSDCVSWQWPQYSGLISGLVFGDNILGVSRCSHLSGCWGSAGPQGHQGRWCVSSGLRRSSRSDMDMKPRHGHVDNPVLMFTLFTAPFICVRTLTEEVIQSHSGLNVSHSPLSGRLWSPWCLRWRKWLWRSARPPRPPSWCRWERQ